MSSSSLADLGKRLVASQLAPVRAAPSMADVLDVAAPIRVRRGGVGSTGQRFMARPCHSVGKQRFADGSRAGGATESRRGSSASSVTDVQFSERGDRAKPRLIWQLGPHERLENSLGAFRERSDGDRPNGIGERNEVRALMPRRPRERSRHARERRSPEPRGARRVKIDGVRTAPRREPPFDVANDGRRCVPGRPGPPVRRRG